MSDMFGINAVRGGGFSGIVFVVALVVVGFIVSPPPMADDPAAEYLEYLADHRTALMIQASLTMLLSAPLFVFAVHLTPWLKEARGDAGAIATAASAAIVSGWVVATPLAMAYGGLAYLADGRLAESDAFTLMSVVSVGYASPVTLFGVGALLSGAMLAAADGARRWAGWLGVAVAALAAVSAFSWADSGFFAPGQPLFIAYLGVMLYFLTVSVLMARSK
jgi:hypothetical protein